ncbi:MAG: Gfo/Idh/MocA family oxidoreductase, partial [Anaerolineae bacterium]|nr:Gfo/Idh/MocA family oxidoreductase [Anaerolineae bacterium]
MSAHKRYAVVGTGSRAEMYLNAITKTYQDSAELVALCDLSQTRMDWHNGRLSHPVPTYHAEQFEQLIAEAKPDEVIVATIDRTHHEYIVRAL